MTDDEPILRASGLALGYGTHAVLRGVELEVSPEQLWVVVGPNGAGKTTLLHAILGLLEPQSGELWLHPDRACRERIAFVPQRSELDPTLPTTVREFASLGLVGTRLSEREAEASLAHALAVVGMSGMQRRDLRALSGGQRQRAVVARALARRPQLLILDEPTSGLDLVSEAKLLNILDDLYRDERIAVMLVTHDLRIAAAHATHVALLHDGGLQAGAAESVLTAERLSRAYGIPVSVAPGAIEVGVETKKRLEGEAT